MIAGLSQAIKLEGLPIWSLHDGQVTCGLEVLPAADRSHADGIASRDGFALDAMVIDGNVFLFQGPLGLTLVDAGTGSARSRHPGFADRMLLATGFRRADIDAILMTHLHFGHAGGLCDGGEALYPNALLFVGRLEAAFWAGTNAAGRRVLQSGFARGALAAYQDRLRLVDDRDELAPGLDAQALYGHTPGMMGFQTACQGASVLFCGDLANLPALQLPRPDWAHVFDADPVAAQRTRQATLARAAAERLVLAGAHLSFPGVGTVDAVNDGFAFRPWRGGCLADA